ncbi:MAG: hypothetical protein M0R30_08765 [Methanoregula sp.]|jgi:hypothetical protein|nr:hypothetical protein [Methanoregula sp.]MCK9631723.1 hypothetical protein [Methanoregula sp.]
METKHCKRYPKASGIIDVLTRYDEIEAVRRHLPDIEIVSSARVTAMNLR